MALEVDGNYFLIHHTPADTIDKIDPERDRALGRRDRSDDLRNRRDAGADSGDVIGDSGIGRNHQILIMRSPDHQITRSRAVLSSG